MHFGRKNGNLGFPSLDMEEEDPHTRKMPLHELPQSHQMEMALSVVRTFHPHIADAIDRFWGFQECSDYLKKLIFDGADPKSHTRAGFRPEVLSALLSLQSFHVVTMR